MDKEAEEIISIKVKDKIKNNKARVVIIEDKTRNVIFESEIDVVEGIIRLPDCIVLEKNVKYTMIASVVIDEGIVVTGKGVG